MALGFTAGASHAFVPRLVAAAAARLPDVDLVPREMTTADQMEALAAGRSDAGLVRLPVDRRGVDLARVVRDAIPLAVPEGQHLATVEAAPGLRDLDRVPPVMYSPTEARHRYDLVSSLFRAADVASGYVQHIG